MKDLIVYTTCFPIVRGKVGRFVGAELIARYMAVSSAKCLTLDLTCSAGHLCMQDRELY